MKKCPMVFIFIFHMLLSHYSAGQNNFTKKPDTKNKIVNDKKEGEWIEYMSATGDITDSSVAKYYRLTAYKQGVLNGKAAYYTMKGKFYKEKLYVNGKEEGAEKEYFDNGSVCKETSYIKGVPQKVKTYHKNGMLSAELVFDNGQISIDRRYDEKGNLKSEIKY